MKRPIAIGLSPDTQKADVFRALKQLTMPWSMIKGNYSKLLENWFKDYFKVKYAVSFNSGRGSLYAVLKAMGIGEKDEVILQGFTCVAVPNSVIWVGARPIYVDITPSLTINPLEIKKSITKKTKAIIVQHTFGIPSDMEKIIQIAKEYNLFVIEDCAHVIGGELKNKKLGTFGDAAIFSFGRDKAFSSVFGGMAITNNDRIGTNLKNYYRQLEYPPFFWTVQQLLHPILFSIILPIYNVFIGKVLLFMFQKMKLLSFPVTVKEKEGKIEYKFIKRLPNALAYLAYYQLKNVEEFNKKRTLFANYYKKELQEYNLPFTGTAEFLRFPVRVSNQSTILKKFKSKGIYLGNWYANCIDPKGVNFKKVYYIPGSCKEAEKASNEIINLPTYPVLTYTEGEKVVKLFKEYGSATN